MFNQTFYSQVDAILTEFQSAEVVVMSELGACLNALKVCLQEAEVSTPCVRQFLDLVLDRVRRTPTMTRRQLAEELRSLLAETSGLGHRTGGAYLGWSKDMPGSKAAPLTGACRWDIKELDNRLVGLNQASRGRLRNAIGLTNERPLRSTMSLRRRQRFQACMTMQVTDLHDGDINAEQVNRLIRYLGWGDSDSDPRGGRHAILG